MLTKRVITALVGAPILLAAVWSGQLGLLAVVFIAVIGAGLEYDGLQTGPKASMPGRRARGLTYLACLVPLIYVISDSGSAVPATAFIVAEIIVFGIAAIKNKIHWLKSGVFAAFGWLYLGLFPTFLLSFYDLTNGRILVLTIFLGTWIADTSAYGIGRVIGRIKLAPKISPNKTVEGAVGSLAVTTLSFWLIPMNALGAGAHRVAFGLVLAAAALSGDLFESWLKRRAGVKDSGNILPGHGGILDRIDSLLFVGPVSYLLLGIWK